MITSAGFFPAAEQRLQRHILLDLSTKVSWGRRGRGGVLGQFLKTQGTSQTPQFPSGGISETLHQRRSRAAQIFVQFRRLEITVEKHMKIVESLVSFAYNWLHYKCIAAIYIANKSV